MPVALQGTVSTGASTNTTNRFVITPFGLLTDYVAVAFLHRWESSNPTVTPPGSGGTWTRKGQYLSGDGTAKIDVWWKRLPAPESGATYQFSWTGFMFSALTVQWWSGVTTSGDPISSIQNWSGTAGTFGPLSVTSTGAPALLWYGYNDSNGTHTPPTHTQSSVQFTESNDADCDALAYRIPGTSGTHTASGGSVTSSSAAAAVLLALEPDGGAPPALAQSFLPFF